MLPRSRYIARIEPFIDKDVIKVVTGMRRSGKSTLMQELQGLLTKRGVGADNIISINFESMRWESLTASADAFYREVLRRAEGTEGRVYLFFDEVQAVPHWEKAVNSLRVDIDCDIFITGSNSKLLSGEMATLLAGRYVSFDILPFSLREVMGATGELNAERAYESFRIYGGMPFLTHIGYAPDSSISYLRDVFNSVVLRDIVQRHGIRNSDQLERILTYFISEVGCTYSVDNIVNVMREERRGVSTDTIYNYLQAAEEAMLLNRVRRYDIKGKAILRGGEKAYLTDIGLREALLGSNGQRVDMVLENIVFIELKRRGYDVHVGKVGNKEIDFVAERKGMRLYIQVAYLLDAETTRTREFSALEEVRDNFPKLVISTDRVDWSARGIRCWNIVDFLLADEW